MSQMASEINLGKSLLFRWQKPLGVVQARPKRLAEAGGSPCRIRYRGVDTRTSNRNFIAVVKSSMIVHVLQLWG